VSEASREELLAVIAAQARAIEDLTALNTEQAAVNADLSGRIAVQAELIAELERRLGRNSRNSSQPPSADGPAAPVRRSRRGKTARNQGKQPGSGGKTLRLVDDPDEVIDHVPAACAGCGGELAGAAAAGWGRRQVHDIPPVSVAVTEHRLHRRQCPCGVTTTAPAPHGVDGTAVYGPGLRAFAVYLLVYQHIPVARTAELIADLTGAKVSTGWVCSTLTRAAAVLVDVEAMTKTLITLAAIGHFDETSLNVNGLKWWLHVASTDTLTAYHLHPSRGRVAVDDFGVLPAFTGTAVHDALSVYDGENYLAARHALCCAHIARELTAAAESHPEQAWPKAALDALHALNQAAHDARAAGKSQIPRRQRKRLIDNWHQAILCGIADHPQRTGRKQSKTRNLLLRLHNRDEQVLLFARDLTVPYSNNQAERDLRPVKTQMKISGCARSETSACAWLRVRGYISTARKNGVNAITAIRDAITGNPYTPTAFANG
jgi:transposase